MQRTLSTLLLLIIPLTLFGQGPAAGQRAEMKKLEWLVGNWKGAGWIQMGPQGRKEFTQTEVIQSKLDGLVLMIEGQGKSKADGSMVHNALAVLSFDERTKAFRWRAFTAEGRQTESDAKVGEKTFEWGMEIPQRGRMRYIITLNSKGEWYEIGEMTQDGQTWHKFFEMTLQRQE